LNNLDRHGRAPIRHLQEAVGEHHDVVGVLVALLPSIGSDRVVSAAPKLGLALGYDVDEALEELDEAELPRT